MNLIKCTDMTEIHTLYFSKKTVLDNRVQKVRIVGIIMPTPCLSYATCTQKKHAHFYTYRQISSHTDVVTIMNAHHK